MKRKENNDSSVPRSTNRNVLHYTDEHFEPFMNATNLIKEKCYGRTYQS